MEENRIKNYPNYSDYPLGAAVPGEGLTINQESIDGEGFTVGTTSVEDYQNQGNRTWNREADPNSFIFRYGLFFDNYSNLEDPTLLGFTIELDDVNSPLFADASNPYSAAHFIEVYRNMPEIAARKQILEEFQKNIKMFFRSQESSQTNSADLPYVKSHYINGVSSLGLLAKKIVNYPEDQLTFNLYEDVTMHSQYLAQLYNNLAYSYRNQKTLIPEDLLRFDMNIKISEIRNFKTVAKQILDQSSTEEQQKFVVNVNSSQLVYKLWGCNFIFFDSVNHGESITQGGIGAARVESKDLELKIKYKAVNRQFKSTFLEDLDVTTNNRLILRDREFDPVITGATPEAFFGNQSELARPNERTSTAGEVSDEERDNNTYLYGNTQDSNASGGTSDKSESWKQKQLKKIEGGFKQATTKLTEQAKKVAMGEIQKVENKVLEQIRRKKGELLNNLIKTVKSNLAAGGLGFNRITPKNVYYGNQTGTVLDNFKNQLGSGISTVVVDFLRNVNNSFGP